MSVRSRSWVIIISLTFLFVLSTPAIGSSINQLERLTNSDFIPEVREAASKALARKYVNQKLSPEYLAGMAKIARTEQLENAVIKALSRRYEDAGRLGSLEEAIEKARGLEEKTTAGGSATVSRAASQALGFYYLAFNLSDVEGYSMSDLENTVKTGKTKGLKEAAAGALEYVYPNHYSAEELIDLINSSSSEIIKRATAGALAIRYSSKMPPDLEIGELREIASDAGENSWLRKAAGRAYGKLAYSKVDAEVLKELAMDGSTEEIRTGAAVAWSEYLVDSDRTKEDLLRMACAATGFAPPAYRQAVTDALADRMLNNEMGILGG